MLFYQIFSIYLSIYLSIYQSFSLVKYSSEELGEAIS